MLLVLSLLALGCPLCFTFGGAAAAGAAEDDFDFVEVVPPPPAYVPPPMPMRATGLITENAIYGMPPQAARFSGELISNRSYRDGNFGGGGSRYAAALAATTGDSDSSTDDEWIEEVVYPSYRSSGYQGPRRPMAPPRSMRRPAPGDLEHDYDYAYRRSGNRGSRGYYEPDYEEPVHSRYRPVPPPQPRRSRGYEPRGPRSRRPSGPPRYEPRAPAYPQDSYAGAAYVDGLLGFGPCTCHDDHSPDPHMRADPLTQ